MTGVKQPKTLGLAFLITLVIAVYGSVLAIDGMKEWYPYLVKPVDIPMWLFGFVQLVYYGICITILYRLFSYIEDTKERKISLFLFLFMMIFAESWNYFFLGLKNVSLGFWLMLVFSLIAIVVYLNLRKTDKVSSYVFLPYLVWLLADISWIFKLWQANT